MRIAVGHLTDTQEFSESAEYYERNGKMQTWRTQANVKKALAKLCPPFCHDSVSVDDADNLHGIAEILANDVCREINAAAQEVQTPTMPYKAQAILEHVIGILQERV